MGTGGSFCPTGGPMGTVFHFPPASYIIRNFGKPIALLVTCLHTVFCLAYSPTLKMEARYSSEASADFQRTRRRYIPAN
jgi:hypothetical protein